MGVDFNVGQGHNSIVRDVSFHTEMIRKNWAFEQHSLRNKSPTYDELVSPLHRSRGTLLGLFCGDALGRPVEFMSPEEISEKHGLLTDMVGDGSHRQEAGTLTDDSDQTIRLVENLIENNGFNPEHYAEQLINWYESDPFDVGITTRNSIVNLRDGYNHNEAGHETLESMGPSRAAGNGSIMRCAPLAIAYPDNVEKLIETSKTMSEITHADPRCTYGCAALNLILAKLIREGNNNPISHAIKNLPPEAPEELIDMLNKVKEGETQELDTSGYVISTLETALHIGLNCGNIENGMITAVNQGGDTDTITAITGAIAGARFGAAFPLLKREDIWLKLKKNKIADLEREEDTIPYRWSKKIKINTDENEMSAFNYARIRADELLERPHIMSQFDNNRN